MPIHAWTKQDYIEHAVAMLVRRAEHLVSQCEIYMSRMKNSADRVRVRENERALVPCTSSRYALWIEHCRMTRYSYIGILREISVKRAHYQKPEATSTIRKYVPNACSISSGNSDQSGRFFIRR
jgi:hypothetical protein